MQVYGNVGPDQVQDGTRAELRLGKDTSLVTMDGHARYQEAVYRGNVFFVCNSASQALSLNSTTATGLILTNPSGSGKHMVLLELCIALLTAPAGISNLIITGNTSTPTTTHTTPLTVRSALLGAGSPAIGLADSAATMPALTIFRPIGGGPVATGSVTSPFIKDDFAGTLILTPGSTISLQCLTTAISVIASATWEEIPI